MRHLVFLCVGFLSSALYADTTYLGLYLQGNKIGYSSYLSAPSKLDGKVVTKNDSRTVVDAGLLGSAMSVTMDSTTWTTKSGAPLRMTFDTESGGRSSKLEALFNSKSVDMTIVNGGIKSKRTLPLPVGGPVVDDPLTLVAHSKLQIGNAKPFYVLDSSTASFMKNTVQWMGRTRTSVNGKPITATLIRMADTRSATDFYVNEKWDIVRVDGPMGVVMLPVSRRVALTKPVKYNSATDLSISTSIKPDRQIDDASDLLHLKMKIVCNSIDSIPSDSTQTATKGPTGWILDIHPARLQDNPGLTIAKSGASKPEWLKPSLNVPCDSKQFITLAAKIIAEKNTVRDAAFAIQSYVYQNMRCTARRNRSPGN